jgi:hypothetical protein
MEREVAAAFRNADPSEILTTVRREIRGRTKRREEKKRWEVTMEFEDDVEKHFEVSRKK